MDKEKINKENDQSLKEEHFNKTSKKEEKKLKKDKEHLLMEEVKVLKEELKKQEEEKNALIEKVKVAQAELVNYRKRKDEETATILKYANKDIIMELLPTVDNFERALNQASKNATEETMKFVSGFNIMYQNIQSVLTKFGVVEINRLGEVFDPSLEQALVMDNDPEKDDEVVLEVLQKGYKLKDRVIRPASVKISQK